MSAITGTVPSFGVSLERSTLIEWMWAASADLRSFDLTREEDTFTVIWPANVDAAVSATNPLLSVRVTLREVLAAAIRLAFEEVEGVYRGADLKADLRACLLSSGEDDNTDVEAYSAVFQTAIWGEVRIS